MAANRKLQTEIQQVLKKYEEGVVLFDDIWDKVYAAGQQSLKEKYESDLKKEIKKLQRLRDQIKTWLSSSEVKDKGPLLEARKVIESKMEQFKICEKDTKTKAYSKEGLARDSKVDPKEALREEKRNWINDCLERLNDLINSVEADKEKLLSAKGNKAKNKEQIEKFDNRIQKNKWHINKLETIIKLLDNDDLDPAALDSIKDSLEYYIESAAEDDGAVGVEDEFDIYEDLQLDSIIPAAVVAIPAAFELSPRSVSTSDQNDSSAAVVATPVVLEGAVSAVGESSDSGDANVSTSGGKKSSASTLTSMMGLGGGISIGAGKTAATSSTVSNKPASSVSGGPTAASSGAVAPAAVPKPPLPAAKVSAAKAAAPIPVPAPTLAAAPPAVPAPSPGVAGKAPFTQSPKKSAPSLSAPSEATSILPAVELPSAAPAPPTAAAAANTAAPLSWAHAAATSSAGAATAKAAAGPITSSSPAQAAIAGGLSKSSLVNSSSTPAPASSVPALTNISAIPQPPLPPAAAPSNNSQRVLPQMPLPVPAAAVPSSLNPSTAPLPSSVPPAQAGSGALAVSSGEGAVHVQPAAQVSPPVPSANALINNIVGPGPGPSHVPGANPSPALLPIGTVGGAQLNPNLPVHPPPPPKLNAAHAMNSELAVPYTFSMSLFV